MSRPELPRCDDVFARFFAPWYQPQDLVARGYKATRPDVESWADPGTPADSAGQLTADGRQAAMHRVTAMLEAARIDWPTYLPVAGEPSQEWVEAFDNHWTAARVDDLLRRSDPSDFSNDLVVTVCEFGAVLGHVMQHALPQLEWLPDWPYWESALLDVPSGHRINVFHWSIKRFSEYGLEDGYAAKVRKGLQLARDGWPG